MSSTMDPGGSCWRLPRAFALAFLSAVLMTLAVPNELFKYGCVPLGFIALIPLYLAVLDTTRPREAALVTGLFGALQHGFSSFWLWFFKDFRFWTLGSTTIAYFVVYMVLGLYLWLFLGRAGKARPLAFAFAWVSFEYFKSTGFLGYPWCLLPYSLTRALPMLQAVDITGVYGLSAMLAAANATLAELVIGIGASSRPDRRERPGLLDGSKLPLASRARLGYLAFAVVVCGLVLGYGLWRMAKPIPRVGAIDAVLVQQDTDPWEGSEDDGLAVNIRLAREAMGRQPLRQAEAPAAAIPASGNSTPTPGAAVPTEETTAPDIVLFSETSLRRPYAEFRQYYSTHPRFDPLVPFIGSSGSYFFMGAPVVVNWDTGDATNSAILVGPDGEFIKSYAKTHPVPFAEAIPFWEFAPFRHFIQKTVGIEAGWVVGTEYVIFELPTRTGTYRFGAPICFEDAFADVCREFYLRDADLLVNLTDVSWSNTDSAEIQHWAAARFRAIESRRTLVRSTNGGLSCVVGPYGEIIYSLPLFQAACLRCEVPVYREAGRTLYIRWGDWFAHAALLLSAGLFIILGVGERRRRLRR